MTVPEVARRAAAFAAGRIAPVEWRDGAFPLDLWREMGTAGLLRVGLPGDDGGWRAAAAQAHALARHGGNLGLALSVAVTAVVGRFVLGRLGSEAQQAAWLPRLADGSGRLAIAVSEPGAGAHPKHLAARAVRDGGGWVIDGEKTWITHGPVADGFLVVAVSAVDRGRKAFSSFLVPAHAAGLARVGMPAIDFLQPQPHCGLRLDGVRVPADALLGTEGRAFAEWAQPLRLVEDALFASAIAGAIEHQLGLAAGRVDGEAGAAVLGEAEALLAAVAAAADRAAAALDAGGPDDPQVAVPADGARLVALALEQRLAEAVPAGDGADRYFRVTRDIVKALGIAAGARHLLRRRRGQTLIQEQSPSA